MNLLKRSSPGPQGTQSSMFGGRLTPSPHYTGASTPGSPLTTRGPGLLLQMGGENSAFKSLVPTSMHLGAYASDSEDEEINVNDESDVEERKSGSSTPVEVVDPPGKDTPTCQPLQLTMHDRDWRSSGVRLCFVCAWTREQWWANQSENDF